VSSLASLAGFFGPAIFTQIFALFISDHAPVHLPGAPFLLSSALLVAAMVLAWNVTRSLSRRYAQAAPTPAIVPEAMPVGEVTPPAKTS
jgi:DHA1 family tetracycline resistance protein-like MFS transporter